jgi:pilus assembly protein Flp/PilA
VELVTYWNRFCAPYLRARFGTTERGASLVEYALLVALIAIVCIGAIGFLGSAAKGKLNSVGSSINSAS